MSAAFVMRSSCLLCLSPSIELAVPLNASPIADAYLPAARRAESEARYPLDLYLCRACGHVQLLTVISPDVLFKDYIYRSSASASLMAHFRAYADSVAPLYVPTSGLAVDIGSNDGSFLQLLKDRGARVLGVDPAVRIASEATASGVPTVQGFFTSAMARTLRADHGHASLVTANNVFAHSDTLPDMADGVRELLAADGVFAFEVSYLGDIVDKLLFDTVYHEHLSYHSIAPLVTFLARHGLEIFDVVRLESKGGSIRVMAQHTGGPHARASIVDTMLEHERRIGLATPALFKAFSGVITDRKQAVRDTLSVLKAAGKAVVGFGASATVTTLLFHFELGEYLACLVDDNVARHGLVGPGLHLPVRPSGVLHDERPDCCVILAWQYAAPIMAKHRAFSDAGGRFVLPMPNASVLQ